MHRLGVVLSALTVAFSGGIACAAASDDVAPAAVERRLDTVGPIDSVIAISIDGLNPNAIRKLGRRGTPTLHKLIRQGATTLNARTALELTDTLPNHTGMVTGRRIQASTGGHGVTWNDDRLTPATVQAAAGHDVASVFDVVHGAGGGTAYFASKTKFSLWERSWSEAIDEDVIVEDNKALVANFLGDLNNETRDFRFLHLSAPDVTGHAKGFMGPAYLRAVTATDRLVGKVLRAVKASPSLAGHTAIILTSDHGGRGSSHRAPARPANYTIPFMVWGPDVARGDNLYAINPTYSAPGRARTSYADAPIRNGDVANLALDLLELSAVPDSEHNADQDLVVLTTEPAAAAG